MLQFFDDNSPCVYERLWNNGVSIWEYDNLFNNETNQTVLNDIMDECELGFETCDLSKMKIFNYHVQII
jgi:hypothetical protein